MWRRCDSCSLHWSIRELSGGIDLARLTDDHENVPGGELELGVGARDVIRPAADRQHEGSRAGAEPALGEALADQVRLAGEANATHRHLGMCTPGLIPRAMRTMRRVAAGSEIAATSMRARSIPRARRISSRVASP